MRESNSGRSEVMALGGSAAFVGHTSSKQRQLSASGVAAAMFGTRDVPSGMLVLSFPAVVREIVNAD